MPTLDPEIDESVRVAVLASGQGSTFSALVEASRRGVIRADVVLLITSHIDAPAGQLAKQLNIEQVTLDESELGAEECDRVMHDWLLTRKIDFVVLAGYVRKVGPRVLGIFTRRILNTHPAPLPRFGGKGMYGDHVHQAVLDSGVSESAATIHFVEAEYDTGPVLAARSVAVLPGDNVASLKARVQDAERELLVITLGELADAHHSTSPHDSDSRGPLL